MGPKRLLTVLFLLVLACPVWAADIEVCQTTLPTTNGQTADCVVSGFGTPKGALVWGTKATANNTQADGMMQVVGFYDGTNQRVIGISALDNVATTDGFIINDTDSAYGSITPDTQDGDCTLSFITDGVRFTCADAPPAAYKVNVQLFGGTGVSNVAVGSINANATQDAAQTSGNYGFQADVIYFISHHGNVQGARMSLGIGWRNGGSIVQRAVGYNNTDNVAATQQLSILSNNRIAHPAIASAVSHELTAIGANTFDLTSRDAGGARTLGYMAVRLNGIRAFLTSGNAPTVTGTNSITGVGWRPQAGMFMAGEWAAENTLYSADDGTNWGIGAFSGTGQFSSSIWGKDAADPTNEESWVDNVLVHTRKDVANYAICSHVSNDSDGVTLTCPTTNGSTRRRAMLFFEDITAPTYHPASRRLH